MDILYLLIPLSVILVFCLIYGLWWAVDHNQFDKLEQHGDSIMYDEERTHEQK